MPRTGERDSDALFSAAKTTIDFLDGLNRTVLYHPVDPDGNPQLPLGYSEFALFERSSRAEGLNRPFKIIHGSRGGPGTAAVYAKGNAELGPPEQRTLIHDLDILGLAQSATEGSFRLPADCQLPHESPFDALRHKGTFIADEEAHWLGHELVDLSELCLRLNAREGNRTGEAMQLIAVCMMMGMGQLLLPNGPMHRILNSLLSHERQPLDDGALREVRLRYHEWRVPLFELSTLGGDAGKALASVDTIGTLYTFVKANSDAGADASLQRCILNHLVAAVQRFTDARADREIRHYGSAHEAVLRVVEHMTYETGDIANLEKWAQPRSNRAAAGAGKNAAMRAARSIVDSYFRKHPYTSVSDQAKALIVEVFFGAAFWDTESRRGDVVRRFPKRPTRRPKAG